MADRCKHTHSHTTIIRRRATQPDRPTKIEFEFEFTTHHLPHQTTLMDVIAGRKTVGWARGEILVNGKPKVQTDFVKYTVRSILVCWFACWLIGFLIGNG